MKAITLGSKFEPAKALPEEGSRPELDHAQVIEVEGEPFLVTTDSYILVAMPVKVEGVELPWQINGGALAALPPESRTLLVEDDDSTRLNGARYDHPHVEKMPDAANLLKPRDGGTTVTFNLHHLRRLADALDAFQGVRVTVYGKHEAIEVEVADTGKARGLLMPIREGA